MKTLNVYNSEDHQTRGHALLSMSQTSRFMTCPGSVHLIRTLPDEQRSSDAAAEGTFAHEVAEGLFIAHATSKKYVAPEIPEGFDPNIVEDMEAYVRFVLSLDGALHIEAPLDFSGVHADAGGTSDVVNIDLEARTLRVVDLKYGRTAVAAEENTQLMGYAVGALDTFKLWDEIDTIELHIRMPRGKNSSWICTVNQLREFKEQLVSACRATEDHFAEIKASSKACQWCRAKPICPEWSKQALKIAAEEFNMVKKKKVDYPTDRLLKHLEVAKDMKVWAEAVEAQAKELLAADINALPGWGLKPGRQMVEWNEDAPEQLKDLGLRIYKPAALRSLKEIMDILETDGADAAEIDRVKALCTFFNAAASLVKKP